MIQWLLEREVHNSHREGVEFRACVDAGSPWDGKHSAGKRREE
jgi:hypothetical protein